MFKEGVIMDLQLFIANSRVDLKENQVQKTIFPLKDFDIRCMWQGYYAERPGLYKVFEEFVIHWEEELHLLLHPQGGIIHWAKEEMCNEFNNLFPNEALRHRLNEQCTSGYAAVWTLGGSMEDVSSKFICSSSLHMMFLDVACSLYMSIIRNALQDYVVDVLCKGQNLSVVGEHIPEICFSSGEGDAVDMRLIHIVRPWVDTKLEKKPSISMNDYGVMQPLKTQCSMLFIGIPKKEQPIHLNTIPCSNCTGRKCLYAQFGGCHLPKQYQPWLKQH